MLLSPQSFRTKVSGSFDPPSSSGVGTLPTRPDKPWPRRTHSADDTEARNDAGHAHAVGGTEPGGTSPDVRHIGMIDAVEKTLAPCRITRTPDAAAWGHSPDEPVWRV